MTESIGMHERRRVFVLAVDIPDDGEAVSYTHLTLPTNSRV